jgi:lariat debranching enzyme
MACPPKYRSLHNFHRYYSGEIVAPVLTVFIGGNHEATSFLTELPYGGWVAKNIWYMGYAGCVRFRGECAGFDRM